MITLLITGVGGPLGQALIKSARMSALPSRIIGTDRHPLSIGLGWVDRAHVIASSSDPKRYLADVSRICAEEEATLVLPASDSELELLSSAAEALQRATGATVVCSTPDILRTALDKCETCAFLEANGHNLPGNARLNDNAAVTALIERFGFPLIAKPCRGSGSRGLTKLRDEHDIEYLRTLGTEMVVQEYLTPDEEEYTVAVYTQRDGRQAGAICFKRELVAGNTYRAWVDRNPAIIAEAEAVVRSLGAVGPCNVQLRLTARGPVTFEINPRFSGTTAMRAHFGYNEVEMAMRDYALATPVPKPLVRPGIALRFWDEVYLTPDGLPERSAVPAKKPALRVHSTNENGDWMRVLHRTTQHDVYFLPAYHALAEKRGEGEARLFVYEHGEYMIALPLMLRPVAEVPELKGSAGDWRDATSVYGYGGPIASHHEMPAEVVQGFQHSLGEAIRNEQVVGVFSRLHPLIPQGALLEGLGFCRGGGETVSIDLSLSVAEQRARYGSTVRNRLNRLVRSGVSCERDAEKRHLHEFVSIYHETMRRVHAHQTYFFDAAYFEGLAESLGATLQLFIVRDKTGPVIASGLFTLCDGIVQYHLGGTRDDALKLSPSALLFDQVRLWANEERARLFHLGGGVGSHADSLFRFKARFSDRRHEFATWRWIIAPEIYTALSAKRARWNSANGAEPLSPEFFPAYRCATRPAKQLASNNADGADGAFHHQEEGGSFHG